MILDRRIQKLNLNWQCPTCLNTNGREFGIRSPLESLQLCRICGQQRVELCASLEPHPDISPQFPAQFRGGTVDWECNCGQYNRTVLNKWADPEPDEAVLVCCEPDCGKSYQLGLKFIWRPEVEALDIF